MALDKIAFCKAWGIRHLIDRATVNVVHGAGNEVKVYYSIMPGHEPSPALNVRGFQAFAEVKQWLQK